ncbi:MAG: hypothetical protein IJZ36_02860, partial [Bacilli bacterium]|nr:hypothetical protein [Bacilli bacterium]
ALKEVLVPITRGFLFWKKLEYKQELIEHIIWNCPDRETAVKIKNQIDIAWTENYKMYYINGKE